MTKIIKSELSNNAKEASYLIQFENHARALWFDCWIDNGDFQCDWNKYIFYLTEKEDIEDKEFQENPCNFDVASSLCYEKFNTTTQNFNS